MYLDQTRFDAFWRNPELYRLTYEVNLVPTVMPYGLARGVAFHRIAELSAAGKSEQEINAALQNEGLPQRAIAVAWVLWRECERTADPNQVKLGFELEFVSPIAGSPHAMVGRLDEILKLGEEVWVGELKTANEKARYERVRQEWEQKKQADFVLLGARALGYDPKGVLVRIVVEGAPPKVWPFAVTRSDHQLQATELAVHQTCEIVEFMRRTFGTSMPWPHISYNYPCSMPDKCEYQEICQRKTTDWTTEELQGFKPREEHLELMKAAAR